MVEHSKADQDKATKNTKILLYDKTCNFRIFQLLQQVITSIEMGKLLSTADRF